MKLSPRLGFWLLVGMNAIWGGSYALAKWALQFIPPATLSVLRFSIGCGVLLLFCRPWPRPSGRDWRDLGMIGGFGIALSFLCHYWGISLTTATKTSLEIAMEPVFLLLMSMVILKEPFKPKTFGALSLAMGGTFLLMIDGKDLSRLWQELVGGGEFRGDLLVLCSIVLGGLYTVLSKPLSTRLGALPATAYGGLVGSLFLLPFVGWEMAHHPGIIWTWPLVGTVLFLGLICTAFGYALWNYILVGMPASDMAVTLNVQPLAGVLVGMLCLGERLGMTGWAGAACILLGVSLVPGSKDEGEMTAPGEGSGQPLEPCPDRP